MKTSEAVNVVLQWIFVLNEFSKAQILPCEYETMVTMLSWKASLKVIKKNITLFPSTLILNHEQKKPTKTQINVLKNFYSIFCILLPSKHTFSPAKPNFYYKPALLLQALVQTVMLIFYILFFIFW